MKMKGQETMYMEGSYRPLRWRFRRPGTWRGVTIHYNGGQGYYVYEGELPSIKMEAQEYMYMEGSYRPLKWRRRRPGTWRGVTGCKPEF